MDTATTQTNQETRLSDLVSSVRSMLRRRWLTLALVSITTFAVGIVLILLMTPKYEATALIRIDPSRNPLASVQTENQGNLGSEAIETEVSVLNSLDLARAVVQRLKLDADPEFTKHLDKLKTRTDLTPLDRLNAVAGEVMKHLRVSRDKLTYIISVSFESEDGDKSAHIANSVAETYLDTRVGSRMSSAQSQSEWFQRQLASLSADARAADKRVADYRSQHNIVKGGMAGTIVDQQVGPLSTQLSTAQSDAAAARARLQAAKQQIAAGGMDAVSEVRTSPVVGDLRRQRAEVLRNMGDIESRYGPRYPETLKVKQQLDALDQQIKAEAERAVGSLEADARAASARAESLSGEMNGLASRQASGTQAAVIADSLERDAASKQAAYDKMAQMSLEANQAARNSIAQAEIVDRAEAPIKPTSPNRPLLAALAATVALALGAATVIVQEMLAGGLRTVADIETQFGLPLLASLPLVGDKRKLLGRSRAFPARTLIDAPTSMFAEALRGLRTSLIGIGAAGSPGRVAFTSALPDEGKTTTALSFARMLAMNGSRTLLVDCDIRRGALRNQVSATPKGGLVEVLRDQMPLSEAIIADEVSGLDLLLVTQPHFTAEDRFGSNALKSLLDGVDHRYDFMILDLPPLLGIADTRIIAAQAEAVVMIVRWGSTPSGAVDGALSLLRADHTNVAGAVYTMVDPTAEAVGGVYYSSKYAAYYQPV